MKNFCPSFFGPSVFIQNIRGSYDNKYWVKKQISSVPHSFNLTKDVMPKSFNVVWEFYLSCPVLPFAISINDFVEKYTK